MALPPRPASEPARPRRRATGGIPPLVLVGLLALVVAVVLLGILSRTQQQADQPSVLEPVDPFAGLAPEPLPVPRAGRGSQQPAVADSEVSVSASAEALSLAPEAAWEAALAASALADQCLEEAGRLREAGDVTGFRDKGRAALAHLERARDLAVAVDQRGSAELAAQARKQLSGWEQKLATLHKMIGG